MTAADFTISAEAVAALPTRLAGLYGAVDEKLASGSGEEPDETGGLRLVA